MQHQHKRGRGPRPNYRPEGWRRPAHNVPVNIADHGAYFTAHVYAVGFAKADIKVIVSDDTLYIHGVRTPAEEPPDFLLQEFPVRHFERSFQLSEHADKTAITAEVDAHGVLVITVPKLASAQAKDIEVEVR